MTVMNGVLLFAAALAAGAINAVAGGGTLVTFPALLWVLSDAKLANATSTVALWPGSVGGAWGYRRELVRSERWMFLLGVPSVLGGALGARLLVITPPTIFEQIVPGLILFATILFMLQEPIARWLRANDPAQPPSWLLVTIVAVVQALIAIYGGYFGAGIGILMLSALSLLRIADIHQMNGLKTLLAICINGVSAGSFIYFGMVSWPETAVMIAGSIAGGYGGASVARTLGQRAVRRVVIAIGFVIAAAMLYRQLGA